MPVPPAPKTTGRNTVPAIRGALLPPQRQVFERAQRRVGAGRGRGHTFNLNSEQAEASEEVVAGTILVHSILVISLFDSGASHYYISTRFIMMHSIPCNYMDNQWEISTGNEVITTSMVCKSCFVKICGRELSVDMFMIDTVDMM